MGRNQRYFLLKNKLNKYMAAGKDLLSLEEDGKPLSLEDISYGADYQACQDEYAAAYLNKQVRPMLKLLFTLIAAPGFSKLYGNIMKLAIR